MLIPTKTEDINLYPLQEKAIREIRDAVKRSKKIILKATCGFGKTVIAAYLIKQARKKNFSCLFLVDRIILADQTSRVFDRYGLDHGIFQGKNPRYAPEKPIQIGSIQTFAKRKAFLNSFDIILIDEVHCFHTAHKKLIENNPDSLILGLSATPYTKGLGKYFDFFVEPFTINDMIEAGVLSPYVVWSPAIADLSKLKVAAGEYTEDSLSITYDKKDIIGDVVDHWKKLAYGKKTIAFGVNVEHIKHLAELFCDNGIKAVQINGYQHPDEKEAALKEFKRGDAQILCSVDIAIKGFDYPPVECVMFVLATRSKIKWEQGVGRGLRISPDTGKEKAIIIDFGGNLARLGWPDGSDFNKLDDGKRKKKKEEKDKIRLCINCQAQVPPCVQTCPACGYDLKPLGAPLPEEDEDAELQDYIKPDINSKEYKKAFFGALNTYACNRDFKNTNGYYPWAIITYQEVFKERPKGFSWKYLGPVFPEVMKFIKKKNRKFSASIKRRHYLSKFVR